MHRLIRYACLLAVLGLTQCHRDLTPTSSLHSERKPRSLSDTTLIQPLTVELPNSIPLPVNSDLAIDSARLFASARENRNLDLASSNTIKFYHENGFRSKWLGTTGPFSLYFAFIQVIENSTHYGMNPDDYELRTITQLIADTYKSTPDTGELSSLDIRITQLFYQFAAHLAGGRVTEVSHPGKIWRRYDSRLKCNVSLANITSADDLQRELDSLHPKHEQYTKLKQALAHYRELDKKYPIETAPFISISGTIEPGDSAEVIPAIRKKIIQSGSYTGCSETDTSRVYDAQLVSAIKWFQYRHGLEPDGRIGKETARCLNLSNREIADLIALNLERLRWLPTCTEQNYIEVNIPQYKLRLYRNDSLVLEMKVIVGTEETATPVFTDTLKYIVFSPTWSVPQSIIRSEIIPRLKRNPSYYSGKGYTFYKNGAPTDPATEAWSDPNLNPYQYAVVQQPGRSNALGLVKFIMPNSMSIYLHDTPTGYLFNRTRRAFSHGCVRLEQPAKLAEYLLYDQPGWCEERIGEKMNGANPSTVYLKKPYQVQLMYLTTWVDENGLLKIHEDIYGHDKRQLSYFQSTQQGYANVQ